MFKSPTTGGQIGFGISHKITHNDSGYPVYIDDAAILEGAQEHIPVCFTAANHTVNGGVDGGRIAGFLVTVEDRKTEGVKVGTMNIHGGAVLAIKDGDALAVGDFVVSAADQKVRAATTDAEKINGVGRVCTAIREKDGMKYAEVVFG